MPTERAKLRPDTPRFFIVSSMNRWEFLHFILLNKKVFVTLQRTSARNSPSSMGPEVWGATY